MRGFPKYLNTKQDYLNCLTDYPKEIKAALQELLDGRFIWRATGIIENEGLTDDTHRVVDTGEEKIQEELIEDERAEIFRLGFTVKEVEEMLND